MTTTPPKPKNKHVPERSCAVCRTKRPQRDLLRLGKAADGSWRVADASERREGRGTYLCREAKCHDPKRLRRVVGLQAERVSADCRILCSSDAAY